MVTNFLQGIGTYGALQAGPNPAGAVLFVSSLIGNDNRGRVTFPGASASTTNGSTQGPQVDPSKPLATLAYALTFCSANRGDTIILMEGHSETLAASITASVAGVNIIGLGTRGARPNFIMGGFSLVLSGAGVLLQNVGVTMGLTANIVGGVQLTGVGAQLDTCHVLCQNVTSVGVLCGANRTAVTNCLIDGETTGFSSGILTGVFDQIRIQDNQIVGIFASAPITLVASTNLLIERNKLVQLSAGVDPVITGVVTATSGVVADNRFQSVHAGTAAAYLGGANVSTNILVVYLQNFGFTGKAGPSSGILIPAVGTIP